MKKAFLIFILLVTSQAILADTWTAKRPFCVGSWKRYHAYASVDYFAINNICPWGGNGDGCYFAMGWNNVAYQHKKICYSNVIADAERFLFLNNNWYVGHAASSNGPDGAHWITEYTNHSQISAGGKKPFIGYKEIDFANKPGFSYGKAENDDEVFKGNTVSIPNIKAKIGIEKESNFETIYKISIIEDNDINSFEEFKPTYAGEVFDKFKVLDEATIHITNGKIETTGAFSNLGLKLTNFDVTKDDNNNIEGVKLAQGIILEGLSIDMTIPEGVNKDNVIVIVYMDGGYEYELLKKESGALSEENKKITSIDEIEISPNPAKDKLFLNLNSTNEGFEKFHIVDLNGKSVLNFDLALFKGNNINQIDITNLNNGVYFLISNKNSIEPQKLVIQK